MKRNVSSLITGIIIALTVSLFTHDNSLHYLRFHLNLYDTATEEKTIEDTLRLFNKHFATFFNTGGNLGGLNEFPAANLIKRRIVQEINEWTKNNQILVYDRDIFEIEQTVFLSPERAVTVAQEVWFLNVQNKQDRKEKSGVKASPIRIRYFLKKLDSRWRVIEYEVFGKDNDIPPPPHYLNHHS
ncbi:MAG: hypothetical protein L0956_05720, partial [Candidatus Mariimomonas ferrooxydans]